MRHVALVTTLAMAGAAQADFFQTESEGAFVETALTEDFREIEFESTVFAQVGPYGFTEADGMFTQTFTVDPVSDDLTGVVVLTGPDPADTVTASYDGVFFPDDMNATFAGVWELTGATGIYEGLVGDGQFSGFYLFEDAMGGDFGLVIQGNLVPAPGAFALVGFGALAAARRRR